MKTAYQPVLMKGAKMADKTQKIGEVTHYFTDLEVGTILLSDSLEVGQTIKIKGYTTDFVQEVKSMQLDHEEVESAQSGDEIGLKVSEKVRAGDEVFLE